MKSSLRLSGFTSVELVIVIAVIGILVVVTVFGFGAWRRDVAEREVQSDLNGVKAAMENARNFSNGYPSSIPSTFTPSDTVTLRYASGTPASYCIDARSKVITTIVYHIDTTSGDKTIASGGC